MQPSEWWFAKTPRKGRGAGRGHGGNFWVNKSGFLVGCRKLVSEFISGCVVQPCEQREENAHGVRKAGKNHE